MQIEYQSQQIEELSKNNEVLEKKVFEMNRDLEIHKEVELSLAEKNKNLKNEILRLKKKEEKVIILIIIVVVIIIIQKKKQMKKVIEIMVKISI